MTIFDHPAYAEHERVVAYADPASGLRAIIAIHNRNLGPAAGGCRLWPYTDDSAALADVLRLSRAMTYKNALAGLPLGGGKAVIIGDARLKSPTLLRAFGRCVEDLCGHYWTAEDIGIGPADVEVIAETTQFVFGRSGRERSGNPAPFTALGCFHGLRAAVRHRLGRQSLEGVKVGVQGVGSVGYELCKLLHSAGASLIVADLDERATARAAAEFDARVVDSDAIIEGDMDVFAPCAMGETVNDATIPRLRAVVVAGSANNQLARPENAHDLQRRSILYAPDYVINAGGMHNASCDILGRYDTERVRRNILAIGDLCAEIFRQAERECRSPADVADDMARARLGRPAAQASR
jgi:leucine dehydrogenase